LRTTISNASRQQQVDAVSIGADGYLNSRNRQIAFFALRHALPTMSITRENVAAGILMSYGTDQVDSYRQAGISSPYRPCFAIDKLSRRNMGQIEPRPFEALLLSYRPLTSTSE
jgi:hypothetical protein